MNRYSIGLVAFLALISVSCSNQDNTNRNPLDTQQEATNYARTGIEGRMSGAYFNYTNELNVADTVLSISSNIAEMVEIHESYITEDELSGMRALDEIILKPDETLEMKPGGIHLMLINLQRDITLQDTVTIQLVMKQAGTIEKILPVKN